MWNFHSAEQFGALSLNGTSNKTNRFFLTFSFGGVQWDDFEFKYIPYLNNFFVKHQYKGIDIQPQLLE